MSPELLRGRLLVATPNIGDPNFARTVVLLIEHDDDGALGVVLNRPSEVHVAEHLPGWADVVASPPVVFVGGPVSPNAALCLARVEPRRRDGDGGDGDGGDGDDGGGEDGGWDALLGSVGTVDLNLDPDEVVPGVEAVRIFAGYAGWAPRQLEAEIAEGGWFVVDADPGDALSPLPADLWRAVLRRQPGMLALFADYPPDPNLN